MVAVTLTVSGVTPSFSFATPAMSKVSVPSQAQRACRLTCRELQRDDAHADQVRAVDALERLDDDGLDAEQAGALGGPVARRTGAVLLAAQHDQRDAGGLVVLRRVVDERLRATLEGEVAGVAARDVVEELVAQTDVRERAADHHLVVTATRAQGVVVLALDTVGVQVLRGRGTGLDRAGRADVVGGDRVAEQREHAGAEMSVTVAGAGSIVMPSKYGALRT